MVQYIPLGVTPSITIFLLSCSVEEGWDGHKGGHRLHLPAVGQLDILPRESRKSAKTVLENIVATEAADEEYDANIGRLATGRRAKIEDRRGGT